MGKEKNMGFQETYPPLFRNQKPIRVLGEAGLINLTTRLYFLPENPNFDYKTLYSEFIDGSVGYDLKVVRQGKGNTEKSSILVKTKNNDSGDLKILNYNLSVSLAGSNRNYINYSFDYASQVDHQGLTFLDTYSKDIEIKNKRIETKGRFIRKDVEIPEITNAFLNYGSTGNEKIRLISLGMTHNRPSLNKQNQKSAFFNVKEIKGGNLLLEPRDYESRILNNIAPDEILKTINSYFGSTDRISTLVPQNVFRSYFDMLGKPVSEDSVLALAKSS